MTDPTPTPPELDLAAIRERASNNAAMHGCTSDPRGSIVCQTARDRDALLDRVTAAEPSLARYIAERTRFGDAMAAAAVPAVVDAIMRELTADSDKRAREATARAEAAEAKIAAVRELHAASPCEPDCCLLETCNECLNTYPCPTIAALDGTA